MIATSVEFMRLFIGPPRPAANPWETVNDPYNDKKVGYGRATVAMQQLLAAEGLELGGENNRFEDHMGIELLYLSALCEKATAAFAEGDETVRPVANKAAWQCHPFRAGDGTLQNVQRQLHGVQRFARLQRSIVDALEEVSFRHQPKRTQVFGRHSPLSAIGSTPKKTLALSLLVWHLSAARDPENSGSWVSCFLRKHRGNSEVTERHPEPLADCAAGILVIRIPSRLGAVMSLTKQQLDGWTVGAALACIPRIGGLEHVLLTHDGRLDGDIFLASRDEHGNMNVIAHIDGATCNAYACDTLPKADAAVPRDTGEVPLVRIVGSLDDAMGQLTIRQESGAYRRYSRWDRLDKGTPQHPAAVVRTLPQCGCGGYLGAPMLFDSMPEMTAYFFVVFLDAAAQGSSRDESVTPGLTACSIAASR